MTISTRASSVLQGLHACPYCLSSNTKDSGWKNSGEKAGRFWLKPVRCRNCHKRFVRYRRVPLAAAAGGLVLGFSVLVEAFNIISKQRRLARAAAAGHPIAPTKREAAAMVPDNAAAAAIVPPKPRPKATPAARAQSRPKSAPRK